MRIIIAMEFELDDERTEERIEDYGLLHAAAKRLHDASIFTDHINEWLPEHTVIADDTFNIATKVAED